MLTLVNVTELNLSVFPGQLTICKFKEDADTGITSSYVGATSANKVGLFCNMYIVSYSHERQCQNWLLEGFCSAYQSGTTRSNPVFKHRSENHSSLQSSCASCRRCHGHDISFTYI